MSGDADVDDLFDLMWSVIHDALQELGVPGLANDPGRTPVAPKVANALLPQVLAWHIAQPSDPSRRDEISRLLHARTER